MQGDTQKKINKGKSLATAGWLVAAYAGGGLIILGAKTVGYLDIQGAAIFLVFLGLIISWVAFCVIQATIVARLLNRVSRGLHEVAEEPTPCEH